MLRVGDMIVRVLMPFLSRPAHLHFAALAVVQVAQVYRDILVLVATIEQFVNILGHNHQKSSIQRDK